MPSADEVALEAAVGDRDAARVSAQEAGARSSTLAAEVVGLEQQLLQVGGHVGRPAWTCNPLWPSSALFAVMQGGVLQHRQGILAGGREPACEHHPSTLD